MATMTRSERPATKFELEGLRYLEDVLAIRRVRVMAIAGRIAKENESHEVLRIHVEAAIREMDRHIPSGK